VSRRCGLVKRPRRSGEWLLKNSIFLEIAEIWGIEGSTQTENVVCRASYLQSFFGYFLVSEFFISHAILQQ
jgi:hypothetical protein